MTNERYTPDKGYPILSKIYSHIEQIYDLFEVNSINPFVRDVWGLILDRSEVNHICNSLTDIREIIGGVLDDIENEEILPYSLREEMEAEE